MDPEQNLHRLTKLRRESPHHKISSTTAQYLPSYGITCIMPLHPSQHTLAKSCYDQLMANPAITSFMTPLPWQSYHVTVTGMEELMDPRNPLWTIDDVHTKLCAPCWSLFPDPTTPLTMNVHNKPRIDKGLSLDVMFPDPREEVAVRSLEETLRRELGTFGKIKPQRYHLTLAYDYKHPRVAMPPECELAMKKILASTFYSDGGVVKLSPPEVTVYESMCAFEPILQRR
eukprot:PhF_6_TR14176/c0_g1_i3/m.22698